jgi:hypothetical protein
MWFQRAESSPRSEILRRCSSWSSSCSSSTLVLAFSRALLPAAVIRWTLRLRPISAALRLWTLRRRTNRELCLSRPPQDLGKRQRRGQEERDAGRHAVHAASAKLIVIARDRKKKPGPEPGTSVGKHRVYCLTRRLRRYLLGRRVRFLPPLFPATTAGVSMRPISASARSICNMWLKLRNYLVRPLSASRQIKNASPIPIHP